MLKCIDFWVQEKKCKYEILEQAWQKKISRIGFTLMRLLTVPHVNSISPKSKLRAVLEANSGFRSDFSFPGSSTSNFPISQSYKSWSSYQWLKCLRAGERTDVQPTLSCPSSCRLCRFYRLHLRWIKNSNYSRQKCPEGDCKRQTEATRGDVLTQRLICELVLMVCS